MVGGQANSSMEFSDYVDEHLLDCIWLEAVEGSQFLHPPPPSSPSSVLFDPLPGWVSVETNAGSSSDPAHEGRGRLALEERSELSRSAPENHDQGGRENQLQVFEERNWSHVSLGRDIIDATGYLLHVQNCVIPAFEMGTSSVTQRLIRAIEHIRDLARDKDILVQVWAPVSREGKRVLTTNYLPFSVTSSSPRLARYRDISVNYQFSAEDGSEGFLGLPGRVFSGKVPEWTPDVQFFRSDEFARVNHARQCDVRGTVGIPVFEQDSGTCIGVVEVVLTTQLIKHRSELEIVCKALEAVDLRSCSFLSNPKVKAPNSSSYQAVVAEIQQVLRFASETHGLPLAQTWASCTQQGREGCRNSDESLSCISTVAHACYVADPRSRGFHDACSEHHLLKGQGIAGRAFLTNESCFSTDVTSFSKTEYPLSHHAKIFDLRAAVAIRCRSIHGDKVDFVLELFLPAGCRGPHDQREMISSLLITLQQESACRCLRLVTDEELREETESPISETSYPGRQALSKAISGGLNVGAVQCSEARQEKRCIQAQKSLTFHAAHQSFDGSAKNDVGIKSWLCSENKRVDHHSILETPSLFRMSPPFVQSVKVDHNQQRQETSNGRRAGSRVAHQDAHSKTAPSSSSQSSNSSQWQSCSSGTQQLPPPWRESSGNGKAKRIRRETEEPSLQLIGTIASHCHKPQCERPSQENQEGAPETRRKGHQEGEVQRIKVVYGDEKIRFRMHNYWRFEDLQREISRRLRISNTSRFGIRYLDDDSEWVLLTCDADLDECIDIYRTSRKQTIKLSIQLPHHPVRGCHGSNDL